MSTISSLARTCDIRSYSSQDNHKMKRHKMVKEPVSNNTTTCNNIVIDMSIITMSAIEKNFFSKRLTFLAPPKKNPTLKIVNAVEAAIQKTYTAEMEDFL